MTRDVMDAKQVAEYLGIATTTVYKCVELRKIPDTKVGHLLRFPKWIIDQWLTEKAQRNLPAKRSTRRSRRAFMGR